MHGSLLRASVSIAVATLALGCASESTTITLANLPGRFEPVARFEDSLHFPDGWLCERPFKLSPCGTGGISLTTLHATFEDRLYFPGVSLASAASADGRVVAFSVLGVGKAGKGVSTSSVANFAFATIARRLRESGVAIVRPRPLTSPGTLYGYLLELDGDGYSILRAASAVAPVPPPAADPAPEPTRPGRNPLRFEVALLVKPPASVIDEARGNDAITWLDCENVVVLLQSCSNWAGPELPVAFGDTVATVAANRTGDVLLVGGPHGFAVKLGGDSEALNRSARALLGALEARGIHVRRVRAAVFDEKGPAYAYLVELDGDGFSALREHAAADAG